MRGHADLVRRLVAAIAIGALIGAVACSGGDDSVTPSSATTVPGGSDPTPTSTPVPAPAPAPTPAPTPVRWSPIGTLLVSGDAPLEFDVEAVDVRVRHEGALEIPLSVTVAGDGLGVLLAGVPAPFDAVRIRLNEGPATIELVTVTVVSALPVVIDDDPPRVAVRIELTAVRGSFAVVGSVDGVVACWPDPSKC